MHGKINVINTNKTTKTKIKKNRIRVPYVTSKRLSRTPVCRRKSVSVCVCMFLHTNMHVCRLGEVVKVYYSGSQQFAFEAPFGPTGLQDLDSG